MGVSPIATFGTQNTTPVLEAYQQSRLKGKTPTYSGVARGDTVSISKEAYGMLESTSKAKSESEQVVEDLAKMEPFLFSFNGEKVDLIESMSDIASKDFGKFLEILEKLRSPDPAYFLDGLAEVFGVSRSEMQSAISEMNEDQLRELSQAIAKLTGNAPDEILDTLYEVQELQGITDDV